ncbi:hydroxyisourate hydrolase [[Empedobacter] haloabium]|uniref:5-hydroxyisourate hydrolase n=1 Tax=[Empedobacter] haloabium TaxID=592317 RepID=A0ABZ1UDK7_9BURK
MTCFLPRSVLPAVFALALACGAQAQPGNPLSVHVLDMQTGEPTAGIAVTLEQRSGDAWRELASASTDAQGRIAALFPAGLPFSKGDYRIVFRTGEHYRRGGQASFFPRIPVEFTVTATERHYHIPLLLSPFGYSTYRGN